MPYYKWSAVDLDGTVHTGKSFAQTYRALEVLLLKQELGLMHARIIPVRVWRHRITLAHKAAFFEQFAQLTAAGLLVPHALQILRTKGFGLLCGIVDALHRNIHSGGSLKESVETFPEAFDPLTLYLLQAGQQSGQLHDTIEQIGRYLRAQVDFYNKLRKALVVPIITLCFFVGVMFVILIALVPSFEQIFTITQMQAPWYSRMLFSLSHVFHEPEFFLGVLICGLLIIVAVRIVRTEGCRPLRSQVVLYMPIAGRIVRLFSYSYFFQALGALLGGAVPLVETIGVAARSIGNSVICNELLTIQQRLQRGDLLSSSLVNVFGKKIDEETTALIGIGEKTNSLDLVCHQLGREYFERAQRMLSHLLMLVQPVLLLFLGVSIALLIVAIYVPLLQMPDMVSSQYTIG